MVQTNFPDWGGVDTAALVVSGLLVVFAALCVIIAFIWIMGKVMTLKENAKKSKNAQAEAAAPKAEPKVVTPAAASKTEDVAETDGISDEVVVAISAAISAMMLAQGNDKPFAIRSIKRVKETRNAWNAAGVIDNTRPF